MSAALDEHAAVRPMHIFIVNQTGHALEFAHPICIYGAEGTPMVKHDRYIVDPGQSCVVYAQENSWGIFPSPVGPKGEFQMRFMEHPSVSFHVRYSHSMVGPHWVQVDCPPGYIYFFSKWGHLQDTSASVVIHFEPISQSSHQPLHQ